MRIKMVRTVGRNLPDLSPDEADVMKAALDKEHPLIEGQVREIGDVPAHFLIRNVLAEETTEELTKLKTTLPKTAPKPEHK